VSAASISARPVALIGLRGAGKSAVGARLAELQGWPFVEGDERTLAVGRRAGVEARSVGELLARAGPAAFRSWEAAALRLVLEPGGALVLACGGGVVEHADSRAWLARGASCVWLDEEPAVLAERLRADPTERPPLLGGADAASELVALARRRERWYRELARVRVVCAGRGVDELAREIRDAWDALAG